MKAPRIVVAGSVNMDLVFRTPRMPVVGETLTGQAFHQIPGGKGANQAVAAARQGGKVEFIGRVGADAYGVALRAALEADGIGLGHLISDSGHSTGIAGILVDDDGHNSIVITAGANLAVDGGDIDAAAALIQCADLLICQLEIPLHTVRQAFELAHGAGARVVFNPAPMQVLDDALLAMVDYLVVNETEAGQLSGVTVDGPDSARQAASNILARGAANVLVTLGAQGVLVADGAAMRYLPGVKVDVIDTTAAGDTFVGALAVGLGEGLNGVDAAARAQYAAALAVTRLGAQTSIPHRAEVEEMIEGVGVAG